MDLVPSQLSGNLTQYESGSSCWLVKSGCSPNISMHFLDKNWLSRLQFCGSCGSSGRLSPQQFLANPGGVHVVPYTGLELEEGLNHGFLPVNISNGDRRVDEIGVVLYCKRRP